MKLRWQRGIWLALLISLLLHLGALISPCWHWADLLSEAPNETLEATLVAPPVKPPPRALPPEPSRPPKSVAPSSVPSSTAESKPDSVPVSEAKQEVPPATPVVAQEAPEVAPPLPRRGRIRFGVYKGSSGERSMLVGRSVHEWQHDGKRYRMNAVLETVGIAALFKNVRVLQVSEGGFLQGELKPSLFRYDRGEGDVVEAAFDWTGKTVGLQNGQTASIGEGAEDMLSMFYQLMQAAQRGENFVMAVATGRKVERYVFDWLGEEVLDIKAGRFQSWHVRIRSASGAGVDGRGTDVTEVWLGKEVAGLPVRIRYTDRKGEVGDQIAEEIDYEK